MFNGTSALTVLRCVIVVSEAGITVLPPPRITDGGEVSVTDDSLEEVASEKWPKKPGNIDSEFFDNDNSWLDGVPEGFSLTVRRILTSAVD